MVSLGEADRLRLRGYPNVARWFATMKARPNWAKVNEVFYGFAGSLKGKAFETV